MTNIRVLAMRYGGRKASQEPDPEIARRLSALPEGFVLDWFWDMVNRDVNKLELLLQLTTVTIQRPPSWDYDAIRREHEEQRDCSTAWLTQTRCWACDDSRSELHRHHIVEVHNGGSNSVRNQVRLCFACHQFLHPWLQEEPAQERRERRREDGFESLGEIAQRHHILSEVQEP